MGQFCMIHLKTLKNGPFLEKETIRVTLHVLRAISSDYVVICSKFSDICEIFFRACFPNARQTEQLSVMILKAK